VPGLHALYLDLLGVKKPQSLWTSCVIPIDEQKCIAVQQDGSLRQLAQGKRRHYGVGFVV
jgi:hypothetical protein